MKKILVLIIAMMIAVSTLTACENKPVFTIYNWEQYIDESVVEEFRKAHPDVDVVYETFTTNEDMYTKLKNGGGDYDVIFPSEYVLKKLIDEGELAELNFDNIPNAKYIAEQCKGQDYDPEGKYTVPYMWGTLGIIYDKTKVNEDEITWDVLFGSKYKVIMMKSIRDAFAAALASNGCSINSRNESEVVVAREKLSKQMKQDNFYGYGFDDIDDKMIRGEADAALIYSGDAITAMRENKNLAYAVPKEGSNKWFDAMAVPKSSKNKELAEEFINFMCETKIAKLNADEIGYYVAQSEAAALVTEETGIEYPKVSELKNCEIFETFDDKTLELYNKEWTKLFA